MSKITLSRLNAMKQAGEKIAVLTCYDASFTRVAEQAGVDVLLVGDTLGMVIQGHDSTLPVTLDDVVYHTANVVRARERALVIADMPFMSNPDRLRTLESAGRLMKEGGAQMVKIEGGASQVEHVRSLAQLGVPVCAHLGLLPQSIHQLGGYFIQGREPAAAARLLQDAQALQDAGAQMLVVECIPRALADEVSRQLHIPVIGIGAGELTDGQVLVLYDLLGISVNRIPRFAHNFLTDAGSVQGALEAYVQAVRGGTFPAAQQVLA